MKKLILFMSVAMLTIVGCSNEDELVYGPNNTIVGFVSSTVTKNFFTNVNNAELSVPITLISYQNEQLPQEDIALSWEIVQSTAVGNAVAGVDYDLPSGGSGTAVIKAGETVSSFAINVHPNTFNPSAPKYILIKIKSATNAIVGKQYEVVKVILQGVCVSALAGDYKIVYAGGVVQPITITSTGLGTYRSSYLPTFSSVYWFDFSDVCGVLTITNWQFQGSNPISGTTSTMPMGVVNPNGSLTFTGVNVAGVSWYVDKTFTILTN